MGARIVVVCTDGSEGDNVVLVRGLRKAVDGSLVKRGVLGSVRLLLVPGRCRIRRP